jgi:hypothetical protein
MEKREVLKIEKQRESNLYFMKYFLWPKHYKRVGGMAQAVEHLPSRCEALSSNPSTIKNKNKINRHCKNTM